jgi:xenotropic and polytropic retrovirus receptor 1
MSLPSWNILLFVYSILLIPALLALLVGLNLVVWARERINYVFIFGAQIPFVHVACANLLKELNVRSRLDHREYFEVWRFLNL